jgi:polyisoprenoid-binding protein YceI
MRQKRYVHLVVALLAAAGLASAAYGADTYVIDPVHTLVGFTVRHLVINKVRGKFNEFTGTITYDERDITRSSMHGTIKTASIDTDNDKRDKDLRSPNFFDTAQYPEITFASKRVEKRDNGYVLIGDLTIKNVTKEVTIPFAITGKIVDPWGKTRIGFEARLRLNRKDFGVNYHKVMDNGGLVVGDTVDIELVGEAIKQGD